MKFLKTIRFKYILVFNFLISTLLTMHAQEQTNGTNVFLSPRITLGYTFGTGLNYGFDLYLGIYQLNEMTFGTSFSYYMVNADQGHHRIKGISLVADHKYFNIKLGAGAVSRRWGLRNINKASAQGLMFDVSATTDTYMTPWVGFKSFLFKREKWTFYDKPSYLSVYTYFRSQDIEIYKREPSTDGQ